MPARSIEFVIHDYPTYPHGIVHVPDTQFTTEHTDLVAALITYPWLDTAPYAVPEALFVVLFELAAGHALAPEAVAAARVLLKLDAPVNPDADDYCPSCFSPVRDGDEWTEGEDDETQLGYRWTSGTGAGGHSTCATCSEAPGAWVGVNRGPLGTWSRAPRFFVHPSAWPQAGYRPDVTADL